MVNVGRRALARYASRMDLAGRSALVTGASSGIGRATTLALARRQVDVKATGRDAGALADVARLSGAQTLTADLSREEDLDRLLAWAGPVDVLVNNAGFGYKGSFAAMSHGLIEEMQRVNATVAMLLTAALLPSMVARGVGHIVNVASVAGYVGVRDEAVYSATKAALIAFSEGLRYELAGTGVGVSLVSPGPVATAFFERQGGPYDRRFPRPATAEQAAEAILRAIERDLPEVFVPRWMASVARLRGSFPGLLRMGASRFG